MSSRTLMVVAGFCSVMVAAIVACTGDDPESVPPGDTTIIINGPEAGGSSSGSSSSGSSSSGSTTSSSGSPVIPGSRVIVCPGAGTCAVDTEVCCAEPNAGDAGAPHCIGKANCRYISQLACDSVDDCPEGQHCCAISAIAASSGVPAYSSQCQRLTDGGECSAGRILCRTGDDCSAAQPNCDEASYDNFFPAGFRICNY